MTEAEGAAEAPIRRPRGIQFPLRTLAMLVVTAAAASALFAKIRMFAGGVAPTGFWRLDVPVLFLLALVLTAVALAAWKEHTAVQAMLQITLACLGCLALIWVSEAGLERAVRYWFQATFALTVTLPMVLRAQVKRRLPRGPRRDWWKKTCEAMFFSSLNLLLLAAGGFLQWLAYMLGTMLLGREWGAS